MRLTSYINNQKCLEWGLNLQQGALFDLLNQVAGWAEPIYIDGTENTNFSEVFTPNGYVPYFMKGDQDE